MSLASVITATITLAKEHEKIDNLPDSEENRILRYITTNISMSILCRQEECIFCCKEGSYKRELVISFLDEAGLSYEIEGKVIRVDLLTIKSEY